MNQLAAIVAALCLCISVYHLVLMEDVRVLRGEFQQRQAAINEGAGYRQLNQRLINALANLAASTGDQDIRQMLEDHGVTYTVNQPAATPAPAQSDEQAAEVQGNE